MVKCKKCGLEFSEPVIEIHESICKVDKKSKAEKSGKEAGKTKGKSGKEAE